MVYLKLHFNVSLVVITPSKLQLSCKLCMEVLRAQTLNTYFKFSSQICKSQNVSLDDFMCVLAIAIYKLIQLSLRYNKGFSFNISNFYSEHVTSTDSNFCIILRK